MSKITNEVLDTKRWRACLDEARKTLDACTDGKKNGAQLRLRFEFDQIYALYAARMYDQGWGKSEGSLTQ